jgi:hypothetical protein
VEIKIGSRADTTSILLVKWRNTPMTLAAIGLVLVASLVGIFGLTFGG